MSDLPQSPVPEAPRPEGSSSADPASGGAAAGEPAPDGAPYRNLWVPLVVVPAVVVGVIVMVFALFGQIAGSEKTIEENLDRMLTGGKNEREQAAFNLVRQVLSNREDQAAGRAVEWDVGPDFDARLEEAWVGLQGEDNPNLALVVAALQADRGAPGAGERLAGFLELTPEQDPRGEVRFVALQTLALYGTPELADRVIALLSDPDHGLRLAAATALQRMPGPATEAALRELLSDPSLELRGTAALSLAHIGDDSGAALLVDLTGTEIYEAAHQAESAKFARGEDVRRSRVMAIGGLARLARSEDRPRIEALARDDQDVVVREAAMRALESFGG